MTVLSRIKAGQPIAAQELFDFITSKVLEQGCASVIEYYAPDGYNTYECVYRGVGGTKCAVGHVIPGAWYSESLEGADVQDLLEKEERLKPSLATHSDILKYLQSAHDDAYLAKHQGVTFQDEFIRLAIRTAEICNLNHAFEV